MSNIDVVILMAERDRALRASFADRLFGEKYGLNEKYCFKSCPHKFFNLVIYLEDRKKMGARVAQIGARILPLKAAALLSTKTRAERNQR